MLKEENGYLIIKFSESEIASSFDYMNAYITLAANYDLLSICEEYCLSNQEIAMLFMYNGGSSYYEISSNDMLNLSKGDEIVLCPCENEDFIETSLEEYKTF